MTSPTPLERCLRMYELPALDFVKAVTEVRRLATILEDDTFPSADKLEEMPVRERMAGTITIMRDHLATIGDTSGWAAAERFQTTLRNRRSR